MTLWCHVVKQNQDYKIKETRHCKTIKMSMHLTASSIKEATFARWCPLQILRIREWITLTASSIPVLMSLLCKSDHYYNHRRFASKTFTPALTSDTIKHSEQTAATDPQLPRSRTKPQSHFHLLIPAISFLYHPALHRLNTLRTYRCLLKSITTAQSYALQHPCHFATLFLCDVHPTGEGSYPRSLLSAIPDTGHRGKKWRRHWSPHSAWCCHTTCTLWPGWCSSHRSYAASRASYTDAHSGSLWKQNGGRDSAHRVDVKQREQLYKVLTTPCALLSKEIMTNNTLLLDEQYKYKLNHWWYSLILHFIGHPTITVSAIIWAKSEICQAQFFSKYQNKTCHKCHLFIQTNFYTTGENLIWTDVQ